MVDEIKIQINQEMPGAFCSLLLSKGFNVKSLNSSSDSIENILVSSDNLTEAVEFLKTHKEAQFNMLFSVSGADKPECFEVIYHLYSARYNNSLILKVQLSKSNPEVESLAGIFNAADWHEREIFDLLGIIFKNHPNLTRILLPEEWIGHPLRKDYKMEDERLAWNNR